MFAAHHRHHGYRFRRGRPVETVPLQFCQINSRPEAARRFPQERKPDLIACAVCPPWTNRQALLQPRQPRHGPNAQITEYPEGRQASAIHPSAVAWRTKEGWLRPSLHRTCLLKSWGWPIFAGFEVRDILLYVPASQAGGRRSPTSRLRYDHRACICGAKEPDRDLQATASRPKGASDSADGKSRGKKIECLARFERAMAQMARITTKT